MQMNATAPHDAISARCIPVPLSAHANTSNALLQLQAHMPLKRLLPSPHPKMRIGTFEDISPGPYHSNLHKASRLTHTLVNFSTSTRW